MINDGRALTPGWPDPSGSSNATEGEAEAPTQEPQRPFGQQIFVSDYLKAGTIQIPVWLRFVPGLSMGAKVAYGTLVWALGGRRKAVKSHSIEFLATVAGVSGKSFSRYLKELEHGKLIQRVAPRGRETHQRYHFLRHEAMYIPEEHYADRPFLIENVERDSYGGYKGTSRWARGVLSWIHNNPAAAWDTSSSEMGSRDGQG